MGRPAQARRPVFRRAPATGRLSPAGTRAGRAWSGWRRAAPLGTTVMGASDFRGFL